MALFDIFKSKNKKQEDVSKAKVRVEFTKEELDAINRKLEEFQSIAKEKLSPGKVFYFDPKLINALKAQGLFEYVSQLVSKAKDADLSKNEADAILNKALIAQIKVFSIHDLPIYVFHLACIYEIAGNKDKANTWFDNFLRFQDEYKPDDVDTLHLDWLREWHGIDVKEAIEIARGKIEK